MGKRREAREAALQFLFGRDLQPVAPAPAPGEEPKTPTGNSDRAAFWKLRPAESDIQRFADEIAAGVTENQEAIDALLRKAAANYELHRITTVDRNILRIAVYEMLFEEDIPPAVSINEAIEIAKRFGTDESGRFVNGVLDRIKKDLKSQKDLQSPLHESVPNEPD